MQFNFIFRNFITKVRHFLVPLAVTYLNPKILGFLFSTKNSLTCEVRCENYTSENFRIQICDGEKFLAVPKL